VELVTRSQVAFRSGDIEATLSFFDPAGEFVSRFGTLEGQTYRGHSGARQYLADMQEAWQTFEREFEEPIDAGDAVVAPITLSVVSRITGVRLEQRIGLAYWIKDGVIVRLVSYPGVEQALEAVGASG
jgi:ketosteroid isomerase-like protein